MAVSLHALLLAAASDSKRHSINIVKMNNTDPGPALERWAGTLLARLAAPARRRLARVLALELRRSQQRCIAAQQDPDGAPYIPRKQPALRDRKGPIQRRKGAMFSKLRQARYLRTRPGRGQHRLQRARGADCPRSPIRPVKIIR